MKNKNLLSLILATGISTATESRPPETIFDDSFEGNPVKVYGVNGVEGSRNLRTLVRDNGKALNYAALEFDTGISFGDTTFIPTEETVASGTEYIPLKSEFPIDLSYRDYLAPLPQNFNLRDTGEVNYDLTVFYRDGTSQTFHGQSVVYANADTARRIMQRETENLDNVTGNIVLDGQNVSCIVDGNQILYSRPTI